MQQCSRPKKVGPRMEYSVSTEVAERNRRFYIMTSSTHFNPRAMVLHWVCELEFTCAQVLFRFFLSQGAQKTWEDAERELFADNGLLSSLSRMTKIAGFLNVLSHEEISDLRTLAKLRNMYAHGREKDEFNSDTKAAALVRSLVLFRQSPALERHDPQGIFMSCCEVLKRRLDERVMRSS